MQNRGTIERLSVILTIVSCVALPLFGSSVAYAGDAVQYCPYWYVDGTTDATLEIANNSDEWKDFTPTLMIGGSTITLPPISVGPGGTEKLSLRSALTGWTKLPKSLGIGGNRGNTSRWGDGSRPGSVWGSAQLRGASFSGIHGWIVVNDREYGLSVNSMFARAVPGGASLLSTWWRPSRQSRELFVLQNTGGERIRIRPTLYLNGEIHDAPIFSIPPRGAFLGSIADLDPSPFLKNLPQESGSVRFDVVGASGGLPAFQGITLIFDESVGFSSPLHMHRPGGLSSRLQLPGTLKGTDTAVLGLPAFADFSPRLLLTNLSPSEIYVDLTMRTPSELTEDLFEDEPIFSVIGSDAVDLPRIHLAPYENQVLNLASREGSERVPDGIVGLEMSHSGGNADVLAEVITVDDTLRYSFYDPMTAIERKPQSLTTVSFDLSSDRNKVVVVKNTSDVAVTAGVFIYYTDNGGGIGEYEIHRFLPSRGLFTVDLRSLRDGGVPDISGELLPSDLEYGHIMVAGSGRSVIASDLAFDRSGSLASCLDPCECEPDPCPAFCPVPILPPPTIIRQFDQTYEYMLTSASGACSYSVCPGSSPPAACSATSFTEPIVAGQCWVSASRKYTITHWVQTDWSGNPIYTFVTCSQSGSTQYWIDPLGPCS